MNKKKLVKNSIIIIVCLNVPLFLTLGWMNKLHMADEARAAIFIDFWGRLTVYSLWFIGYGLYEKHLK